MWGSSPLPLEVTASAGTCDGSTPSSAATAALAFVTESMSVGLSAARLVPPLERGS